MELTLNLGWALVAMWMVCVWLRMAARAADERRAQFVALAVAILILLPAISMTDDLMAALNPAEFDCSVRRDHGGVDAHCSVPALAELAQPAFKGSTFNVVQLLPPTPFRVTRFEIGSLVSIQNRPPPAA
jgi:uncharacterized membrane protein YeiB